MIHVDGSGFCDDQVIVFSTIGQGPKGEKGEKGEKGDTATQKNISMAVNDFLENHPEYITRTTVILAVNSSAANAVANVLGSAPTILRPSDITDVTHLMPLLDDKDNLAWVTDDSQLEIAPIRITADLTNSSSIMMYARGFNSIACGVMGVDMDWEISDIQGSYIDADEVSY